MLTKLQQQIGYNFSDQSLLSVALTHSSYANEHRSTGGVSYERLEFLGDSILGFISARFLYGSNRNSEGELTRMRASLVCEKSLACVAAKLNLGEYIMFGKGEVGTGGRKRRSVLADVVEAILAAIYLDGGLEPAIAFVDTFVLTSENLATAERGGDFKTELQEFVQRDRDAELFYRIVSESGPDHDKMFVAEAVINGKVTGSGSGHSKKEAEQAAARAAVESLYR